MYKCNSKIGHAAVLAAIVLMQATASTALAQEWPTKPVKTVVAFTAGGTTDIIAREVSNELSKMWDQSVVVENKPGAAGNIGTGAVVNAKPDGYTILMNSIGPIAVNPYIYAKSDFNTMTDLRAVALVADVPNVLVVAPSLNVKSVQELTKQIEAKPGSFNCASTGVGTAAHLSCAMMAKTRNLTVTHIPYKGADALNDVMSGRVQFMFATLPSVMGNIKGGKLIPLAVSTTKRSPALKDVPTMQEAGYKDFAMGSWFGYFAPAKTPENVIQKLNKDINTVLQNPTVKTKLSNEGAEPVGGSAESFTQFVKAENEKWKAFTAEMNISAK
ncbi:tripartite-type tricarboxylate transporter receptor subunit TctC [Advenella incenata]|jgi:tripartite-type tricarboxylate transporter receptor subunit TctC|uniref:Tripartite-type tricarboxylate transporter receptor subunit TctC n=1 Tax=Advenella incenata TaxID=267800 RepID=A0A4Q7VEB4_9BURK|nr:tripartite tricarboxylate transporter substrate binding protein [Advenella incenata]RZT93913.1 tripartite-type tricarboxylate transporter receptor subunit TctC [Advenella incenata]